MNYGPRFDRAAAYAVDSFRDIRRKGTDIPYISHLFAVTALVAEGGGDEEQLCAALLHDALEDVPGCTPASLSDAFGPRVSRLVVALSDSVGEHPKPPWQARKERYVAHLTVEPPEVKLISAADKLHNAQSLRRDLARDGAGTFARFTGGTDGTMWYYRAVSSALAADWGHPLVDELHSEIRQMERLLAGG